MIMISKITSTRSTPKLDFIDSTIDKSKTNKYEANGLEITPESITYQDYLASSLSTPFSIVNNDKVNFNVVYNEKSQEWCKFFEEMTGYIYGWRCFSNLMRGISIPNESVSQYNKDCRDIMKDSIDKLKYYYAQQKSFVYYFIHTIISYHNNNDPMIMTPSVLQATIFMMGSFGMTDEMVRIKNSIKNDFSYYNKINEADMEMRHDQSLAIFLATPYSVRTNLIRSLIVKKDGYSNFFITVIEYILNTLDSDVEIFMASDVKYYLTSLLICLDIVLNEFSVGKLSKKINMQSLQKIYIKYPLVHVIGDQYFDYRMELRLLSDKKKKKINFIKLKIENDKLPLNYIYFIKDEIIKGSNYLIDKYVLFKLEYMKIGTAETKKYLHFVSQLHIECLRFMNFWNENINLFYIGKLNKPALKHSDSKFDEEYENDIYASAIMKNVSSEEYNSLISCILYMKKFQQHLFDVNKNMVDLIKKFYYYVCKDFFSSLATKNTESNKAGFPTLVNVIKESFPFFFTNDDRSPIYLHYEEILCIREALYISLKKDKKSIKSSKIEKCSEKFLVMTENISQMYISKDIIRKSCDFSYLWFREMHIEFCKHDRIQYPLYLSMPSILSSKIATTKDDTEFINCIYTFEIYNDAANYIHKKIPHMYLYEELESEINVNIIYFCKVVGEQLYNSYKHLAIEKIMTFHMKKTKNKQANYQRFYIHRKRINKILNQNIVEVGGRSVNLRSIIIKNTLSEIKKNLSQAISQYENGNFYNILKLKRIVKVNKIIHSKLSIYSPVSSFEDLFMEADSCVTSRMGRIYLKTLSDIGSILLTEYSYNSTTRRFVTWRKSNEDAEEAKMDINRDRLSKIIKAYDHASTKFIGSDHFEALVELIGPYMSMILISHLLPIIISQINGPITKYIHIIKRAFPERLINIDPMYGIIGVSMYFKAQLKDIVIYKEMANVLFVFAELGNFIVICNSINSAIKKWQISKYQLIWQYIPDKFKKWNIEQEPMDLSCFNFHSASQLDKTLTAHTLETIKSWQEDLSKSFTLDISSILNVLSVSIKDIMFAANTSQFQHQGLTFSGIWNAITYYTLVSLNASKEDRIFGDSVFWGGLTLVQASQQYTYFKKYAIISYLYDLINNEKIDVKTEKIIEFSKGRLLYLYHLQSMIINFFQIHDKRVRKRDIVYYDPPGYNPINADNSVVIIL